MAKKRSSRSVPLNTLAVLSHKELGHKGFDTSFHNPLNIKLQEMGLELRWRLQLVLDEKNRQFLFLAWGFCIGLL